MVSVEEDLGNNQDQNQLFNNDQFFCPPPKKSLTDQNPPPPPPPPGATSFHKTFSLEEQDQFRQPPVRAYQFFGGQFRNATTT